MQDPERLDLPSASSFEIVAHCHGQPNMIRSLGAQVIDDSDELSELGTKLHTAWETDNTDELTDEQSEIYAAGRSLRLELLDQWMTDFGIREYVECPRELRLWLNDPVTCNPVSSAQLDTHFHDGGPHLLVSDYKSLWCTNLAPSYRSWQLRLQAVLAWREYDGVQHVRVGFVKAMKGRTEHTDYTLADLQQAEDSIRFHLYEASRPDAQRTPGLHCRWCKAKPFCKEASAWAMLPSVINGNVVPSDAVDAMVESMPENDLVLVWSKAAVIEKVLEAVKRRLKNMTDAQLNSLGLRKTPGRKLDPIVRTKEAFDFFLSQQIDEAELWTALTFGKGELQKAIQRSTGWRGDATKGYLKQVLEPFIEKKQAEQSLARL